MPAPTADLPVLKLLLGYTMDMGNILFGKAMGCFFALITLGSIDELWGCDPFGLEIGSPVPSHCQGGE